MSSTPLSRFETPFAIWTEATDPATGLTVPGQGGSRFYRFEQPVRLEHLEIPLGAPGMGGERTGGEPRRVVVSAYGDDLARPTVIFAGEVPPPAPGQTAITVPLGSVVARAAAIQCTERYPVAAAFESLHPTPWTVPFALLDGVKWFGDPLEGPRSEPPFQPPLRTGRIAPRAVVRQNVMRDGFEVRFTSRYLAAGFSLKRPQLMFLGWDALGKLPLTDFLFRLFRGHHGGWMGPWGNLPGGNGPYLASLLWDAFPHQHTGTIEVAGNIVRYLDVRAIDGVTTWTEFEVGERDIEIRLRQAVERDLALLDAAAWGFVWDGKTVPSLATNAAPIRGRRRNGGIVSRGGWNVSGLGSLNFSGDGLELQIDTTGFYGRMSLAGLQLGTRHEPDGSVTLLRGEHRATLRLEVRAIEPVTRRRARLPDGIRRCWGSPFAFRPEAGGFSNNGFGVNCQNCLYLQADLAPYTAVSPAGPDMVELLRDTATLAVQGGPGYASHWDAMIDAAPSLGISIARVHQARPDLRWLRDHWPHLRKPWAFLLDNIDDNGLLVCRFRSGNSGERQWSSNAWDTVCFGHYDAYSNALAYRALRGGVAVAKAAGDADLSRRCRQAAENLRRAYVPVLQNPATGLIAGWRSRDGQLHDYGFAPINAMAIVYGIIDRPLGRQIMKQMEHRRVELGITDFRYGLPTCFAAVPRADYRTVGHGSPDRDDGRDTFGMFVNGALMPTCGYFYLSALSHLGFKKVADQACAELLESFAARRFEGTLNSGTEYFSHDGSPTGYEGTLVHGYHILLAIAQHRGLVKTLDPEWWPAEG